MQTTCQLPRQHLSPLFLSAFPLYLAHHSTALPHKTHFTMAEQGEQKGPSASKILAVVAVLPFGGTLLLLSGLTFVGSLIGLAFATPLFIIFSPVLVPASIGIGLAVTGILSSGAFGMTALSSLSWFLNYIRLVTAGLPEFLQNLSDKLGQKTKEMGLEMHSQAHDDWAKPSKRIQIGL